MTYERPITANERLYLAVAAVSPPFLIQLVVEGRGRVPLANLRGALEAASTACPGARLVARSGRWVDTGRTPPVREAPLEQAARTRLDPVAGPSSELVVDDSRLLFRAFQGAMDGSGLTLWMRDVFRALRGEPLLGAPSTTTDEALVARLGSKVKRRFEFECASPFADAAPSAGEFTWHHRSIPGTHTQVLGRLGAVLCRERALRFMLPIDLRSHAQEPPNTGNLAMPVFLDAACGERPESIEARLAEALGRREELAINDSDGISGLVPGFGLKAMVRMAAGMQRMKGKYLLASAVLSHGEPLALSDFSAPEFTAQTVYALPAHSPLSPLTLVALANERQLELSLACAAGPGMEARAEALLERLAAAFG